MRFAIFRFIGTKDELKRKLAAMTGSNVIHLGRCELCGGLAKGPICRKCEPTFLKWTRIIKAELRVETNKEKGRRISSQQPDNPIIT